MTTQANIPAKWYVPFANGDVSRVEIPVTTADPTRASQTLGFPPLTMQPPESGGVPPQGEDFNGGMNQIARVAWWVLNGGGWPYDASFATQANIQGYPNGAKLQSADFRGDWISTADGNQNNPDTNGTGWVPGFQYGVTALSGLTGGTVTPTPAQAAKNSITLAGTLTSALTVVLPAWLKNWTITNSTTGAFVTIVKTAAGSGVTIPQNGLPTRVTGDGANIVQVAENIAPATGLTQPPQVGQLSSHGQCEFFLNGANVLLRPYNGNKLIINGVMCTVPNAGVSGAPTGLTPGTRYLVYALDANGDGIVDTLEFSTTTHVRDTTTGVEIKSGDSTRTLVGQVQPIAGPAFVDSIGQRYVRDWFNRRRVLGQGGFTTGRSTSSATPVELNSEIRCAWLSWEGEVVWATTYGIVTLSGAAGQTANTYFGLNSTTSQLDAAITYQRDTNSNIGTAAMATGFPISEGSQFLTILGSVSASTAAWGGSNLLKIVVGGGFL